MPRRSTAAIITNKKTFLDARGLDPALPYFGLIFYKPEGCRSPEWLDRRFDRHDGASPSRMAMRRSGPIEPRR
jgi:hypothetical protein